MMVALRYLTDYTRPDLSHVTGKLGCATQSSTIHHWRSMKAALWYLVHTLNKGITVKSMSKKPLAWHFSKYIRMPASGDHTDRKWTPEVFIAYKHSLIYWTSKRQSLLAICMTKCGYIAEAAGPQNSQTIKLMDTDTKHMAEGPCLLKPDV